MILWLNGAFGAGKTQTAYALSRRLENAYIFDPENAGYYLRKNLPPSLSRLDDFQDYPLWRHFNFELLRYIAERYEGVIIVPMTVTDRAYYDELIGRLSEQFAVRHVILCASKDVLLKRLASRLDGKRSWPARQIDRCITAFERDIPGVKLMTDRLSIDEVAEQIGAAAGLSLLPDKRGPLAKAIGRAANQLRHIR